MFNGPRPDGLAPTAVEESRVVVALVSDESVGKPRERGLWALSLSIPGKSRTLFVHDVRSPLLVFELKAQGFKKIPAVLT